VVKNNKKMNNEELNQFRTDIDKVDSYVTQCIELMSDSGVDYDEDYERMYDLFEQVQSEITKFQELQKWI